MTPLGRVMLALTWLGSGWLLFALVPLAIAARTRRFALVLGAALAAQAALVWALKHLVARTRPFLALGTHPLVDPPHDFSFPSGHASGSFAVAAFVATWCATTPDVRGRHAIAAATVLLACGVALSRVYLGVHYPGDVAGGAVVGGAIGVAAALWHRAGRSVSLPS